MLITDCQKCQRDANRQITPQDVADELLAVSPSELRSQGMRGWGYLVHLSDAKGELECWGSELWLALDGGAEGEITFGRKDAGSPEFVATVAVDAKWRSKVEVKRV